MIKLKNRALFVKNRTYILLSPAKLNLYLKVLNRRPDNYHNINSLIQKISLFDILKIKILEDKNIKSIKFSISNIPENNTILKAINLFKSLIKIDFGYNIEVIKNIPMEAGLGGGSSNAATVLKFLNYFFKTNIPLIKLIDISTNIGADVPLFLSDKNIILITGIGENIKFVNPDISKYKWFLLVIPDKSLSTKKVYKELNFVLTNSNKNIMEDTLFEIGYNDLEKPAFKILPELKVIKDKLKEYTDLALMTGSGSTIYSGFEYKQKAVETFKTIEKLFPNYKKIIVRAL